MSNKKMKRRIIILELNSNQAYHYLKMKIWQHFHNQKKNTTFVNLINPKERIKMTIWLNHYDYHIFYIKFIHIQFYSWRKCFFFCKIKMTKFSHTKFSIRIMSWNKTEKNDEIKMNLMLKMGIIIIIHAHTNNSHLCILIQIVYFFSLMLWNSFSEIKMFHIFFSVLF